MPLKHFKQFTNYKLLNEGTGRRKKLKVMEKKDLREVIYTLQGNVDEGFNPHETEREKEIGKERKGLFHRWADEMIYNNGEWFPNTYGIVEDLETHKIKNVVPIRITFTT
jgi:hypothetical protein